MNKEDFVEIINIEYEEDKKIFQSYMDKYSGLSNTESEFNLAEAVQTIISNDYNPLAKINNLINYLEEIDGEEQFYFGLNEDDSKNLIEQLNNIAEAIETLNITNDNCGKKLKML